MGFVVEGKPCLCRVTVAGQSPPSLSINLLTTLERGIAKRRKEACMRVMVNICNSTDPSPTSFLRPSMLQPGLAVCCGVAIPCTALEGILMSPPVPLLLPQHSLSLLFPFFLFFHPKTANYAANSSTFLVSMDADPSPCTALYGKCDPQCHWGFRGQRSGPPSDL